MIGRVSGSGDRNFLCLVTIYAAHVLMFHVLDGSPSINWSREAVDNSKRSGNTSCANDTAYKGVVGTLVDAGRPDLGPSNLLSGQLGHKVFTSGNEFQRENSMALLMTYPKINLDFLYSISFINRMKNMFTTVALSSPTWGILSGCIIFLLTYTDRDNTLQT